MDMHVTLPKAAESISPVLITAPTNHSGTVRLQKLLCSSQESICYGDNLFEETLSLVDWASSAIKHHQEHQDLEQQSLRSALDAKPTTWMPELGPEFSTYISSIFSVIYNVPHSAQEFAASQGRNIWGMARPAISAGLMTDLLAIFPSGKAIFISRNPFDIAQDILRDRPATDLQEFCEEWNNSMRSYLSTSSDRLLKLRYEDQETDPVGFMAALSGFVGTNAMDASIIGAVGEAEMSSGVSLSPSQQEMIGNACVDMLSVYYPDLAPGTKP